MGRMLSTLYQVIRAVIHWVNSLFVSEIGHVHGRVRRPVLSSFAGHPITQSSSLVGGTLPFSMCENAGTILHCDRFTCTCTH
jgi:hypothetical protein